MRSADLELLYHELGQLVRTGLPLGRAMESMLSGSIPRSVRQLVEQFDARLKAGGTLSEAVQEFPELDRAVLGAGADSGHLERSLAGLARYHEGLARARSLVLRKAAYPLFLLHFGILILGLPALFAGGTVLQYLRQILPPLLEVYLVTGVAFGSMRLLARAGRTNRIAEQFIDLIPILGRTRRDFCVSRFCTTYATQLDAAIPVLRALSLATEVSGSARIRVAVEKALPEVTKGAAPGPLLEKLGVLPLAVARGIRLGEETGKLDEELERWAGWHLGRALAGVETLGEWIPRLFYLGILLLLGWKVITAYQGVLSGYEKLMDF